MTYILQKNTPIQDKMELDSFEFGLDKDVPIAKMGVFPYLGKELDPFGKMGLEPNKIYKVYRSEEELKKAIEAREDKPDIPFFENHQMVGKGFQAPERKGIEGTLKNLKWASPYIKGDINVLSENILKKRKNGKKELSAGYLATNVPEKGIFNGEEYDFVQKDINLNHLALVDEGRMGCDVCLSDQAIMFDYSVATAILDEDLEQVSITDPYANQHAFRMIEPSKFQSESFKRKNIDAGVDIIIGRLKGETTTTTQAYRFNKDKFTYAQAKKWMEEHVKERPILSEEATEDNDITNKGEKPMEPKEKLEKLAEILKSEKTEDEKHEECVELFKEAVKDENKDITKTVREKKPDGEFETTKVVREKAEDEKELNEPKPMEPISPEIKPEPKHVNDEEKEELKKELTKELLEEMAEKAKLVGELKPHIGDNADYEKMTKTEVADYACKKLAIADSADALSAVRGFLAGAKKVVTVATLDNTPAKPVITGNDLDKFLAE